jgi:hypothetical protein
MRPGLEEILRRRYPSLYDRSPRTPGRESAPFSPDLGDGCFAILLALSEVIDRHASAAGMEYLEVLKISPGRHGGLHYHLIREDHFIRGAITAANHLSLAVSTLSGRPGRPMVSRGKDTVVLAPDEVDGHEPVPPHYLRPLRPPIGAGQARALGLLGRRWGDWVEHDISVPAGWADLADVVLTAFARQRRRIDWIRAWDDGATGQLVVEWDRYRTSATEAGAVAFATTMAALTDPVTGASGPVDDTGAPAWWRNTAGDHAELPVPWGTYDSTGAWHSREDMVCGPAPGHPSAGALAKAAHGGAGEMQLTLKPHVAQVMRQMARTLGQDGCAAFLTKMLGVPPERPEAAYAGGEDAHPRGPDEMLDRVGSEADASIRTLATTALRELAAAAEVARTPTRQQSVHTALEAVATLLRSLDAEALSADQMAAGG